MNKIDNRRTYYLMLDCETANSNNLQGQVDPSSALVYDLGFAVVDKNGRVYHAESYIIREVFYEMSEIMDTAYYSDKVPMYLEDIVRGIRTVASFYEVREKLHEVAKQYKVKAIIAHNARFDYTALQATQRYLTSSKYRYFFPYGVPIWDTLKMVRSTIAKQKSYINWCIENDFLTKNKQPRCTAEILTKYFRNDLSFEESHTGLEDVMIEVDIFKNCMKQHKKMDKELFSRPYDNTNDIIKKQFVQTAIDLYR